MNTLSKISLSALFAIFLTACEKPNTQSAEQKPEQVQASEVKKEEVKPVDTGAEDYKTFRDWQDSQEKALNDAIQTATDALTDKQKADPAIMQETVNKTLLTQLDSIKASAEALNIQNSEVKALKDKTLEVLTLGTQMIIEGANMEKNPTPEAHKAFGELQTKLNQLAEEGQKLENELKAKYAPDTQPEVTPAETKPQETAPVNTAPTEATTK
ncbi:lipoprotein Hlp [Mannheimia bovis]|uniref:Lipoprotein Hlp n=1 Tax=Mannheimia bovis TaxID=2770636 RepID=A0A7H1C294_9PAST|nr:lipoprotein Hlp [Mannheimia bovis]QNS15099.1 lipoprotein Hlp [Mannheimia bovis]